MSSSRERPLTDEQAFVTDAAFADVLAELLSDSPSPSCRARATALLEALRAYNVPAEEELERASLEMQEPSISRKRWHADTEEQELYLRRCSEVSTHQLLDMAGVPRGGLSINGRLAIALGIRFACLEDRGEEREEHPSSAVAALIRALPAGPWRLSHGARSVSIGDVRLRPDGGEAEQIRAIFEFIHAISQHLDRVPELFRNQRSEAARETADLDGASPAVSTGRERALKAWATRRARQNAEGEPRVAG